MKKNQVTGKKMDRTRDEKGRFVKGSCANPTGRPKTDQTIKDLLAHLVPKSIKLMEEMLDDPGVTARDKIKITEIILDRVYGKPYQAIEVDAVDTTVTVNWDGHEEYGE